MRQVEFIPSLFKQVLAASFPNALIKYLLRYFHTYIGPSKAIIKNVSKTLFTFLLNLFLQVGSLLSTAMITFRKDYRKCRCAFNYSLKDSI